MRVVTGHSSKDEGFLYITQKSMEELATHIGLHYFVVANVKTPAYKGDVRVFVHPELTQKDVVGLVNDPDWYGEFGRGIWWVYDEEVVEDVNLADAVCW